MCVLVGLERLTNEERERECVYVCEDTETQKQEHVETVTNGDRDAYRQRQRHIGSEKLRDRET